MLGLTATEIKLITRKTLPNKYGTEWKPAVPTSVSDKMNGVVCRVYKTDTFRSYNSDTQKKAIKKKTVRKKVVKRKT
jgi:hypothetical protein